jgi:hypothetical protein
VSGRDVLVELLDHVVTRRDASALADNLHDDFRLLCNGATYERAAFLERVAGAMLPDDGYTVDLDDEAWVEQFDRVACRVWVTLTRADADTSESEIVLIATVRDGRFHRAWVLIWPDRPARRSSLS